MLLLQIEQKKIKLMYLIVTGKNTDGIISFLINYIIVSKICKTGVGGVLYPPNSFNKEMIDSDLFKEIAPTTDDIWFWAAAVAKGTYIIPIPLGKYNKPKGLKKPKNLSLKTVNFKKGSDLNRIAFEKKYLTSIQ